MRIKAGKVAFTHPVSSDQYRLTRGDKERKPLQTFETPLNVLIVLQHWAFILVLNE
jgi:hypothetical protein